MHRVEGLGHDSGLLLSFRAHRSGFGLRGLRVRGLWSKVWGLRLRNSTENITR